MYNICDKENIFIEVFNYLYTKNICI